MKTMAEKAGLDAKNLTNYRGKEKDDPEAE